MIKEYTIWFTNGESISLFATSIDASSISKIIFIMSNEHESLNVVATFYLDRIAGYAEKYV